MTPLLLLTLLGPVPGTAAEEPAPDADVLYEALHAPPLPVDAHELLAAPGRFVGQAVRARGRLERSAAEPTPFQLVSPQGRILLRPEAQAAAVLAARGEAWAARPVQVEGLFYREAQNAGEGRYALRAWRLRPVGDRSDIAPPPASPAPLLTLEDLVYSAGRHDGKLVRVRGRYRGSNPHKDLPEATRKGPRDWVLKEAHFAVWVASRADPVGATAGRLPPEADVALEVLGVPTTSNGVVHLEARHVEVSLSAGPTALGRAVVTGDAGYAAVPPRLSFVYPPPGEALRPRGRLILQFSKPMDPARLEAGVRVRYEGAGAPHGAPRLRLDYRDRYRALVVTPEPPPPPGVDVVVELLEGIIDVDGRALEASHPPIRLRSAP